VGIFVKVKLLTSRIQLIYNDYKAIILGTNYIYVNIDKGITVITNLYTAISIVDVNRLINCG